MLAEESIAFITGATSGIGAACARLFASRGARVVLTGRDRARLDAVAATLAAPVHVAVLDVRDREAVAACVAALPAELSSVTHLVNNAGLALGAALAHEASLDDWETMIDTNVKGLVYCTRALLPRMVASNRGHVINIGSVAGSYPYPGGNVYGATKAFVHQLSLGLRADLLGTNVRVTSIEPGMVETSFSRTRFHGDEKRAAAVYQGVDAMTADDIAELALFCAERPARLNVNRIEVMATMQAFGPFAVKRRE
jgi:3-hydroxy acid dehydrogenase / malonic semialdehyde reductase